MYGHHQLGLEPADIERFKTEIERVTGEDGDLTQYGPAMRTLLSLEETTGLALEDRLGDLLESLGEREPEEVQRLVHIAREAEALPGDIEQLGSAVEQAVEILEYGFELDTAERLAAELDSNGADDQQAAIETLVEVYDEYEQLSDAVEGLRVTKETLESDCDSLRETRSVLEEERVQLQETIERTERSLGTLEGTLEELRATKGALREDITRQRDRLEAIEADLQDGQTELEAIQEEREIVHAYRRYLADAELSDTLLNDIRNLLDIESAADTAHLESYKSDIRERTISELRDVAFEMLEGEQMMPVAEHERKLREKGDTERTLEELERERQAVLAFMDFLDTGDLSERLLKELRDLKRGRSNLPEFSEERKSREVREFLVEQLGALTGGEAVITERRHHELLEGERSRHREQLDAIIESFEQLTAFIDQLPMFFDEEWRVEIAQQVVEALDDTHERVSVETLQEAFQEVIADEFEEGLDFDSDARVVEGEVKEGGVGLGSVINSGIQHSNSDEE